ncbi:hypothetical protein PTKIN_Ptkin17bG0127600 [Pterospermum kingtungense]
MAFWAKAQFKLCQGLGLKPKTRLPEFKVKGFLFRLQSPPFQFSSFLSHKVWEFFFLVYFVLVAKWRLVSPLNVLEALGRSLFAGLGNGISGLQRASNGIVTSNGVWSQQQRTFIQMRTVLNVVDNSGAKKVMCIQALKGKKGARLGDTIVASVKEAMPNGKVKKGKVVYGVVVRAAMQRGRCDGSEIKFDYNAVVLVDKQGQPIGTRVFGPVPHELRQKKHVKILTLAKHIS